MKLQLLLLPALLVAISIDLMVRPRISASALVLAAFAITTVPFAVQTSRKDPIVGLLSPALLAARACAQVAGVIAGIIYTARKPVAIATKSTA